MAVKIEMPKLSDTMEEGVIAKWNVEEGDEVSSGDVIAEVETDKATMEVEVFDDGTILKILAKEGDAIPLGGLIAVVGEEGEDISDILDEAEGDKEPEKAEVEEEKEEVDEKEEKSEKKEAQKEEKAPPAPTGNGRIKASPLARKMAEDKGIDLNRVEGSGPEGRIIKRDIEDFKPAAAPATQIQYTSEEDEDVKISQMRKTIARRLAESKFTNPHFYETVDIDMEHAIQARDRLNEISEVKISFNDIVVKACAAALRKHPYVNSSWMDDVIRQHGDVNIAVAVAIEEGLMTPVINHADKKNLRQISTETRELAGLAKEKKLQPEQMEGSTFTVSNLGMFGIEEFTAIINPPNVCILAVGAIRDVPVVKDGEVVPGKRMKVTLSSDHRVVDGAKAADFLNTLRELLENPLSMLL
ncbi:MAG: pyruvate dehydrogenase complex dihydrolipoamide acetyltransferase [Balneolaceae bacterium]|nr:pyruvate dehydrogenase complex dihydrolipoamide acetyltransferase [Balneolaceae bacterium]